MINELNYFRTMDAAVESLGFNPYDRDDNNYTSFFWGLVTCAYLELVTPAVSHLPRQAAICAGKALESWADGDIEKEEDIIARAQKQFEKWFNSDFMGIWRNAALKSRLMLSRALEEHVNKTLSSKSLPEVSIDLLSMRDVVKALEKNLREEALPFMLHEIFSYEFVELDDEAEDRASILQENCDVLKSERDFRMGLERGVLSEVLVTEDLIFDFACAAVRELNLRLNALKFSSTSAGN